MQTSSVFLACFLACTFAFVVFAVIGWQVVSWLVRKKIKEALPKIIHDAMGAMVLSEPPTEGIHNAVAGAGLNPFPTPLADLSPRDLAFMKELQENAKKTPPGVIPHLSKVECGCGTVQDVPLDQNLSPYLTERGWRCEPQHNGWACPKCVGYRELAKSSLNAKK